MISVIIPLYNKGRKVCKTIDSVLKQEYNNFEVVVVDDGSKDESANYVKQYTDSRIHYFYKENGGVSSARNYGIKVSKGEWLIFLDADDELADNAFSMLMKLHGTYPKCKCLAGRTMWLQNGIEIQTRKNRSKGVMKSRNPFFLVWCNKMYPATRNMMIHRSLIDEYGSFDERMSFYEDWEFSLRMLRSGEIACTDEYIGIYNQDGTGLSASRHPVEKGMAFYIPELIQNAGFWEKCLLFSNIEETKNYWIDDERVTLFYYDMQREYFSRAYSFAHKLRQKLLRIGVL